MKLGDLCGSETERLTVATDQLIDYIDISSVSNESKSIIGKQTLKSREAPSRAQRILKSNDILVSTVRPNLNAVAVYDGSFKNLAVASTGFCVLRCKPGVNHRFIFNICKSRAFIKALVEQATGASYPAVNEKIIRAFEFPDVTYECQEEVAARLDTLQRIIDLRKQQLRELDDLIKARFVEMFGVPGTDVHGWGLLPLGTCCELNPKKGADNRLVPGLQVSFVPMPAVSENGSIDTSETKTYDEVKAGFTYFAENDVLFAKITPCMENGKGAVAVGLMNGIGFGSTEFHVLRPIALRSNPYWLYTFMSFESFRKDAAANMTGSAGQRRVPASFLERYKVSLPPINLQEQFAVFVSQIDKSKLIVLHLFPFPDGLH